jgi:hypothetical protein
VGLGPSEDTEKSLFSNNHELRKDRVEMHQINRLNDLDFPSRLPKVALNGHLIRGISIRCQISMQNTYISHSIPNAPI